MAINDCVVVSACVGFLFCPSCHAFLYFREHRSGMPCKTLWQRCDVCLLQGAGKCDCLQDTGMTTCGTKRSVLVAIDLLIDSVVTQ